MIYFIIIILIFSLFLNGFLIWYVRNLLSDLTFISSSISTFKHNIKVFLDHLQSLKKMDIYSEEPTIKALYAHADDLLEYLKEFDEILFLTDGEEMDEEEEEV